VTIKELEYRIPSTRERICRENSLTGFLQSKNKSL
jgi:hypothetical protein